MKKLTYLISLFLVFNLGISQKGMALNNNLVLTSISPASGPYICGSLIQLNYTLDYTIQTGHSTEIQILFDGSVLALQSVNNQTGFPGPVITYPGTNTLYTYTSLPELASNNNFHSVLQFSVTFRVVNTTCGAPLSSAINATATTIAPDKSRDDIQEVNTPVTIQCNGSNPTVTLDFLSGSACGLGIYKITSFGLDQPNSNFQFTLPTGVTILSVYNSSGQPVLFNQAGNIWSWDRSGIASEVVQIHYVVIQIDQPTVCANAAQCPNGTCSFDLLFNTHTICSPNGNATANTSLPISPCTTCTECSVIPVPGGVVSLCKTLVITPFRYLPAPDNCMTHDYYLKIDNFSNQDLVDFKLNDHIGIIGNNGAYAIKVLNMTATLSPMLAGFASVFPATITPGQVTGGSYSVTLDPTPSPIPSSGLFLGNVLPSTPTTDLVIERNTVALFPKFNSLLVKITHKLDVASAAPYENVADLDFVVAGNSYNARVKLKSKPDNYDPIISLEKMVRNVTTNTPFSSTVNAVPYDIVEFVIKIKNYGMSPVTNAVLNDVITNPSNNLFAINPNDLYITGPLYSPAFLAQLQYATRLSITNNGFTANIGTIEPAICTVGSELIITYQVRVKKPPYVVCNSEYINTANLSWMQNSQNYSLSKTATVKIDLFKNVLYKLEASCTGPNGPWQIGSINAIPGQQIWYKATVRNNNNYQMNNIKVMVQVPQGGTYSSTHNTTPVTTLTASMPGTMGLTYVGSPTGAALNFQPNPTNNWLTTALTATGAFPNKVIYQSASILANSEITIEYAVTTPFYIIGSPPYITAMGVSLSSANNCPIVRQTDLKHYITQQGTCGKPISGCKMIHYDYSLQTIGIGIYRLTISNIIDMNGGTPPNISNMEVVVHQPYKNCTVAPTTANPFPNPMAPFTLSALNPATPLTGSLVAGARAFRLNGFPVINGSVVFDINIPPSFLMGSPACPARTIPVNISFWDNTATPCPAICEQMIYLSF